MQLYLKTVSVVMTLLLLPMLTSCTSKGMSGYFINPVETDTETVEGEKLYSLFERYSIKTLTTGTQPYSVTAADLNGDGHPDLISADRSSNQLSVFLNDDNGDNTPGDFAAATTLTTGTQPISVTAADLNGDGHPDLISADRSSNQLSVFLNDNNGDNTPGDFAAATTLTTGTNPYSVTAADLNGDGHPDLISADYSSSQLSVFLNDDNGDNTPGDFAAATTLTTGSSPVSVTAADLNGDGHPDLISADYFSNQLSVFLNDDNGDNTPGDFAAATTLTTGSSPVSVTAADLNGDGHPDLISADYFSNQLSVFLNDDNGDNTPGDFAAATTLTTGSSPVSVTAADLNGDGHPDLISADYFSNQLSVFLNDDNGDNTPGDFAAATTLTTGTNPSSVTAADLNGDGHPDLISADRNSNQLSVFLNDVNGDNTPGDFAAATTLTTGTDPRSITAADLNGDGHPDLISADYNSNQLSVFLNDVNGDNTPGDFAAATTLTTGSSPVSVTAADLNGDGHPDLISADYFSNQLSVFLNDNNGDNTPGDFAAATTLTTGTQPRSVTAADLNGDGHPDLISADLGSNQISVFLNDDNGDNTPGDFAAATTLTTGTDPRSITAADLNGDGHPDLISADNGSNQLSVFLNDNNGDNTPGDFAAATTLTTGTNPVSVTAADLNGDGYPDLISADGNSNQLSVFLNDDNGDNTPGDFAAATTLTTGTFPYSVTAADLNGDGHPDLISADYLSNQLSVFLNDDNGDNTPGDFAPQDIIKTNESSYDLFVMDVNSDDWLDIIYTDSDGNSLKILINDGL